MSELLIECQNLPDQVYQLLQLIQNEPSLKYDSSALSSSLRKVGDQKFEIVFAGAVSAGKSILINALLEQELLYSEVGHATGTECQVAYAESEEDQRVVLTFLTTEEIQQQINALSKDLNFRKDSFEELKSECQKFIQTEGGEGKSKRAIQARAMQYLIDGFFSNTKFIDLIKNNTTIKSFQDGVKYVQKGSNSSVLKRVEYFCHHSLLKDGNVLVDTPGIDANSPWDAELTYKKIKSEDASAVVCVFRADSEGQLSKEETDLFEHIRANPGIRNRVFYVFNRIDITIRNAGLRQKLEHLIQDQFTGEKRLYRTSALFGFYGSQILKTDATTRFGLEDILNNNNGKTFVNEFIAYLTSNEVKESFGLELGKLGESPESRYERILQDGGHPHLIEQLIEYSNVKKFCTEITQYLNEEKRPQLFRDLASDLRHLCNQLLKLYQEQEEFINQAPQSSEGLKERELNEINTQLQSISHSFEAHIKEEIDRMLETELDKDKVNECRVFKDGLRKIQDRMLTQVNQLISNISTEDLYYEAVKKLPHGTVASIANIVSAALDYLASELEKTFRPLAKDIVEQFFQYLHGQMIQREYWKQLEALSIRDAGIEQELRYQAEWVRRAIDIQIIVECDRYRRESDFFYGTRLQNYISQIAQILEPLIEKGKHINTATEIVHSIFSEVVNQQQNSAFPLGQLPQISENTKGYGSPSMTETDRQVMGIALKREFNYKVNKTVCENFPQVFKQTLRFHLQEMIEKQYPQILQQASKMGHLLDDRAEQRLLNYQREAVALKDKVETYDTCVRIINHCLVSQGLGNQLREFQSLGHDRGGADPSKDYI